MSAPARILLVDDDPISLRILRRALETGGDYEIRTAAGARAALDEAQRFLPDLIISDKIMPEMDGLELCRRVKAEPVLAGCIFVILTSLSEPEARVQGLELGADDYLVKPIPAEELKARVRSMLRRRATAEAPRAETGDPAASVVPAREVADLLVRTADLAVPGAGNRVFQMLAAAQWMAEDLRLDSALRPDLNLAVEVHELGKIALPPRLWRTPPSKLTSADRETLRAFPAASHVLLRSVTAFQGAAALVRHLYENWDGSGLPDHLHQGLIPLGARILRVLADFFEDLDLVSDAPSRKHALERMQDQAGRLYDPAAYLALSQYVTHHLDASLARNTCYVRAGDLRPGMRLAGDLVTNSGAILLRQGALLDANDVRRIQRHHAADPFLFSIRIHPAGS